MYSVKQQNRQNVNPFNEFFNLADFFSNSAAAYGEQNRFTAYSSEDTLTIYAEIPGIKMEFVSISTEDNSVKIKVSKDDDNVISYKPFEKEFTLSKQFNIDSIKASIEDGVLQVSFDKHEASKTKNIEIN